MPDPDLPYLWPEPWAGEAFAQAASVKARMEVAYKTQTGIPDEQRDAARGAIKELLASVRVAVMREEKKKKKGGDQGEAQRLRRKRRLADRWRGTSIEWAYSHLHAAKPVLVELLPVEEVDALIPSAIARIGTCLDANDVRRLNLDQLQNESNEARRRAGLKQALEIGYDASDQLHARARSFRNILVVATIVISVLMVVIVALVAFFPWAMPLCFEPTVPAAAATRFESGTESIRKVCPSGEDMKEGNTTTLRDPTAGDVIIVAVLGLLGGALAGTFAIRKVRGTSTPYGVPLALAVLKLPTGALTAVIGILLLGGGFVPGFSELDSQRQILAYALLFGYAQQLGTQFIDKRAETILHAIPAKDAAGKQPTQPSPGGSQLGANAKESNSGKSTETATSSLTVPLPAGGAVDVSHRKGRLRSRWWPSTPRRGQEDGQPDEEKQTEVGS